MSETQSRKGNPFSVYELFILITIGLILASFVVGLLTQSGFLMVITAALFVFVGIVFGGRILVNRL